MERIRRCEASAVAICDMVRHIALNGDIFSVSPLGRQMYLLTEREHGI